MSWVSGIAIFFIVWWTVLFAVLPFGVRSASEDGEAVIEGNEAGAPVRHGMAWKLGATTLISIVIFAALMGVLASGAFERLSLPFMPGIDG